MKLPMKTALVIGVLALGVSPAALAAGKPETIPPNGQGAANGNGSEGGPEYAPANPTPGPQAGLPAKAKAYGRYCQGESRKHVAGEPGTPFSNCVTKMAMAANHKGMAPGRVCKGESKQHVKGEKGTAFSRCVTAAAKLRRHEHEEESA